MELKFHNLWYYNPWLTPYIQNMMDHVECWNKLFKLFKPKFHIRWLMFKNKFQNIKMEKRINMEDFFLTIKYFIIQIIGTGDTYHDLVSIVINALPIPNEYETFVHVRINILTRQILFRFDKIVKQTHPSS